MSVFADGVRLSVALDEKEKAEKERDRLAARDADHARLLTELAGVLGLDLAAIEQDGLELGPCVLGAARLAVYRVSARGENIARLEKDLAGHRANFDALAASDAAGLRRYAALETERDALKAERTRLESDLRMAIETGENLATERDHWRAAALGQPIHRLSPEAITWFWSKAIKRAAAEGRSEPHVFAEMLMGPVAGAPAGHVWTNDAEAEAASREAELREAAEAVLRGFDAGAWVRNISGDGEGGWAIKAMPHLVALGRLVSLVRPPGASPTPADWPGGVPADPRPYFEANPLTAEEEGHGRKEK